MKSLKTRENNGTLYQKRNMSSWKSGWREIGGNKKYYRSRWEANYARYLESQKQKGLLVDWQHEPKTFWFENIKRGTRSYLPDFLVIYPDGSEAYHEVKGWMDERSSTKIKRMKKYYPSVKLVVIDSKSYNSIGRKVCGDIIEWEFGTKGQI